MLIQFGPWIEMAHYLRRDMIKPLASKILDEVGADWDEVALLADCVDTISVELARAAKENSKGQQHGQFRQGLSSKARIRR